MPVRFKCSGARTLNKRCKYTLDRLTYTNRRQEAAEHAELIAQSRPPPSARSSRHSLKIIRDRLDNRSDIKSRVRGFAQG
jgi:hypothetical protein